MKIGVNARFLGKPFTGIGQYTKNIFRELSKIDKHNEYILVVPEEPEKDTLNGFPDNVGIKIIPERKLGTAGMKKTWWEQISVPDYFVKEKVGVAFFPYPANPWSKDFYKQGIKAALTIHDCIPWMRKSYRRGFMSKLYHKQSRKAAKYTDIVFTVSNASKKDVINICGVEEKNISVVYNDAGDSYKEGVGTKELEEVLHRFTLRKHNYFLYVGGYDERKNIGYLKEEYSKFCQNGGDIPLVLVGGKLFDSRLYNSFDKKGKFNNIVKTGFLDESSLAALYNGCRAFVNVSEQEGFNIPILEAANSGAPLILSDIAVHREIARDSAVFVDASKSGELTHIMKEMMSEENFEKLSEESQELAKKYSWSCSAQEVKDVLFSS